MVVCDAITIELRLTFFNLSFIDITSSHACAQRPWRLLIRIAKSLNPSCDLAIIDRAVIFKKSLSGSRIDGISTA